MKDTYKSQKYLCFSNRTKNKYRNKRVCCTTNNYLSISSEKPRVITKGNYSMSGLEICTSIETRSEYQTTRYSASQLIKQGKSDRIYELLSSQSNLHSY